MGSKADPPYVPTMSMSSASQRCHICGKIDSGNRKGERFRCVSCGHEEDADHNAAKNLEYLGLAGVYSLRLLPNWRVDYLSIKSVTIRFLHTKALMSQMDSRWPIKLLRGSTSCF